MQVTDGDAESAVVGPDHVEVKAGAAGDVKLGLLAGVSSLVVLARSSPGRLCNEKEMISWDSKNLRIMIILRPFMRDKRRRRASPLSKCSMFCSIRAAIARGLSVGVEMGKVQLVLIQLSCTLKPTIVRGCWF